MWSVSGVKTRQGDLVIKNLFGWFFRQILNIFDHTWPYWTFWTTLDRFGTILDHFSKNILLVKTCFLFVKGCSIFVCENVFFWFKKKHFFFVVVENRFFYENMLFSKNISFGENVFADDIFCDNMFCHQFGPLGRESLCLPYAGFFLL